MQQNRIPMRYPCVAAVFFAADQVIKYAIRKTPVSSVILHIEPLLEITHCANTGAAFSLLRGQPFLIAALSVVLTAILLSCLLRTLRPAAHNHYAISILLGGGLGNLFDRLAFGAVTDYIRLDFIRFPVFNLADIGITLSVAVLAADLLLSKTEDSIGEEHHESND